TEDYHTRAETRNLFLAVQALPIVSASGYSRMGLVLGVGRTAYQLARKDYASPEVTRANTSGPALLLESYIDWGGEDFGARIAYSEIRSRLNKTAVDTFTRTPDASAHMVQLMLRWAFE
ncbi:MAG: hypothetical protein OEZ59_11710, partial [Deltaproteobacteria bacterium]|nr:hypothetical protein [Deltaproteobacteria bacterium]